MLQFKFPNGFQYNKPGIHIEEDICDIIPDYEELQQLADYIIYIREKYCPITNYDISGRSSRGLFIGIPDSGVEAYSFLQNNGISEIAMCTYTSDRRSQVSRNCYLWGCDSKVNLTSLTLMDTLERWYPLHAVMTPVYLNITNEVSSIQIKANNGRSLSIKGIDLYEILKKCFETRVPFVCLRINKSDLEIIKKYELNLRAFEIKESQDDDYYFVALVPPIRVIDESNLEYPGEEHLPTIISQKQIKTIWERGGDLKSRTEQWIKKECNSPSKAENMFKIIDSMVNSEDKLQQQDSSIYTALYQYLFKSEDKEEEKQETVVKDEENAKPLVTLNDEEENVELIQIKQKESTEEEKQLKYLQERAKSRVRDFKSMLPDYLITSHSIRDYLDIGCADGAITIAIGKSLNLTKEHIFGCDVRDLPPESDKNNEFSFKHYDGLTLPYCDNSFDIITVYMVLHHIPEIKPFLKEIIRVLKPGGFLLIREHNCDPEEVRLFLDVQHGFYALVLQPTVETPNFCTTFQTYFRSRQEWRTLLQEAGVNEITSDSYSKDRKRHYDFLSGNYQRQKRYDGSIPNLLNSYYGLFRKVAVNDNKWQHDCYDRRAGVTQHKRRRLW